MKLNMFSIHDQKAEAFLQPFFSQNQATGIRIFRNAVNDPSTVFNRAPGDYTLFEIGIYDQINAEFSVHDTPINLGIAISFKTNETITPILKEVSK